MHIPKKIEGLENIETRKVNTQLNGLIDDLANGAITTQQVIGRLHSVAVRISVIDDQIVEARNVKR